MMASSGPGGNSGQSDDRRRTLMRDDEIDDALRQTGGAPAVDPALLDHISRSIAASLRPVRPLYPPWVLIAVLIAVCGAVATVSAALLGFHGMRRMSAPEMGLI